MICCSLLLVTLSAEGAGPVHPVLGKEALVVRKPRQVVIYTIAPFPVLSIEQVPGERYIYDYPIRGVVPFPKNQMDSLQTALLDTASYIAPETRKCPFTGAYALMFTKGKQQLVIIISDDPCPKAILFCPGSPVDKKHIDLADNCAILRILRKLGGQPKALRP